MKTIDILTDSNDELKEHIMSRLSSILWRDLTEADNAAIEDCMQITGMKSGTKAIQAAVKDYVRVYEYAEEQHKRALRIAAKAKRIEHIEWQLKRYKDELKQELERTLVTSNTDDLFDLYNLDIFQDDEG